MIYTLPSEQCQGTVKTPTHTPDPQPCENRAKRECQSCGYRYCGRHSRHRCNGGK